MRSKQERQGKQNASDKKLQLAMAKAEKAPEAEEKERRIWQIVMDRIICAHHPGRVRKGTPNSDSRWFAVSYGTRARWDLMIPNSDSKHLLCGSYNALSSDYIL
jgi:hypothetical protein